MENQILEISLNESNKRIAELEELVQDQNEKIKSLQKENRRKDRLLAELSDSTRDMEHTLQHFIVGEMAIGRESRAQEEAAMQEWELEQASEASLARLQEQLPEARVERDQERTEFERKLSDMEEGKAALALQLSQALNEKNASEEQLRQALAQVEAEREQFDKSLSVIHENSQKGMAELRASFAADIDTGMGTLREQVLQANDERDSLAAKLSTAECCLADLKAELADSAQLSKTVGDIRAELSTLQAQLSKAFREKDSMLAQNEAELAGLRKEHTQVLEEYMAELSEAHEEKAALKIMLTEYESKLAEFEIKLSKVLSDNESLKFKLCKHRKAQKRLEGELSQLEEQSYERYLEIGRANSAVEQQKQQLLDSHQALAETQHSLAAAHAGYHQLEWGLVSSQQVVAVTERNLAEEVAKRSQLSRELARIKLENENLKVQREESEETVRRLKAAKGILVSVQTQTQKNILTMHTQTYVNYVGDNKLDNATPTDSEFKWTNTE